MGQMRTADVGDQLEVGMKVKVITRAYSGNTPRSAFGKVLSVVGGAARINVEGESHPRTVRFNQIEIVPEGKLDREPLKQSLAPKLQAAVADAPRRVVQRPQIVPAPQQQRPAPASQKFVQQPMAAPQELRTVGGKVWIIEVLTPQMAELFLKNQHPGQRKLRDDHVISIAKSMESGTYKWTGDAIKFDKHDRLIDGQHRLTAVTLSGVTLRDVLAIRVNDDEVSSYLDTNIKARTLADVRKFQGQKHVNNAVIAAILIDHTEYHAHNRNVIAKAEQNTIVENCAHLEDLQRLYSTGSKRVGLTAAHLSGMLRCLRANREEALTFFVAVCQNDHMIDGKHEPVVKLLVDWLTRHREQRVGKLRGANAVLGSEALTSASKVVRAYNAWRRGEVLTKLQAGDGMPEAET